MKKIVVILMVFLLGACSQQESEVVVKKGINEEYKEEEKTYKYQASDLETDKVETVYVDADGYGNVSKIEVETKLRAKEDGDLVDLNVLNNVVNTSGDENYKVVDNKIVFENHGSDITYKGDIEKQLPVNVRFTYYLDGKEISVDELAHKSGHLKVNVEYLNNTKVPFICLTTVMLNSDKFFNIKVDNGKLLTLGDTKMLVLYGEPGLKDNLMLYKIDGFDDIKLNDSASFESDVEDFTLDYTTTIVSNGLFKEIENKDLNDLSNSINDLGELNDKFDDIKDASNKLKDEGSSLKDGVNKLNDAINALDTGIGEYSQGINQIGAITDNLVSLTSSIVELLNNDELNADVTLCNNILDSLLTDVQIIINIKADVDLNNENIDHINIDAISDEESKNAVLALKKIDLSSIDLDTLNEVKENITDLKNKINSPSFESLKTESSNLKNESVLLNSDDYKELLVNGMTNISLSSSSLKKVVNSLNDGMPDVVKAINEFADKINEAIDETSEDLNENSINDMKTVINNIKKLKQLDTDYDSFVGKIEGMTSSVSFIIETAEIK